MTAAVSEKTDASSRVAHADAPDGGMGAYIDSLRDDCGLIIGSILGMVKKLTGRDLLAELLEPIAGDFDTISSMQAGWREAAVACGAVGENFDHLAPQLTPGWEGEAKDAADAILIRISDAHDGQREGAELIAEQMDNMIEVSKATAEAVCAAIEFIDSVIQEVIADAAIPVIGWGKGAVTAPGKVKKVISLISRGKNAIENLLRAVKACITAMKYLNALLDTANLVLSTFKNVGDANNAGNTHDTAKAAF